MIQRESNGGSKMRQTQLRGRKIDFYEFAGAEGAGFQQGANYMAQGAPRRSVKLVNKTIAITTLDSSS
jgi:hypothetical protein